MSESNKTFNIGDEVSMAFNGDYYPMGTIAKISPTGKIIHTTTGRKFVRQPASGYYKAGKTFSLIHGNYDERNPHF